MAAKKKPKPLDESAIKKKPRKKKEPTEKKEAAAPKPKKSRKKEAEVVRLRIFWGVFNHQLKRVALFDFNQRKAAEKRAEELSTGDKPHFVQKVKEKVEEVAEKA
ncbi:MAG: hypothetical protein ACK493_13210 [Planctomycetota bacterium]|jgi:hypothetical protein|nr:hypothetical protein [Blastopirellula sp.]